MATDRTIMRALADLVGAIGTDGFAARLLDALNVLADVDLCSVFVRSRRQPLRLLLAEGRHPINAGFPMRASLDYIRTFWKSDRRIAALTRSAGNAPVVVRTSAAEIADPAWRAACYERGGVAERVSIVRAGHPAFVANGYRLGGAGGFSAVDLERIETHSGLLMAAVERHAHASAAGGPMLDEAGLAQSLLALQCGLSNREAEISAAMMLGETQEEIASRKQLSHGSVVTYRRRAYGKLGIDNRRALLRLHRRLMAGLPPGATEPANAPRGGDRG